MLKKHRKNRKIKAALPFTVLLAAAFLAAAALSGWLPLNAYFSKQYEVRGVDVSHYQGTIDWEKLKEQDVVFAFIKATEGSGHVDGQFAANWKNAGDAKLKTGAYHFFSFDSPAKNQAELYIDTVGELSSHMVPAVDVEYYAGREQNPPDKEEMVQSLRELLRILEEHYHVKPVIYTTYAVYNRYIKGGFDEYPLWIRNVYYPPVFGDKSGWTFWQYSDTAVLEGYEGTEKYIDMNVFRGSEEELEQYLVP